MKFFCMSGNFFVCSRKVRDIKENFLVCPEKFLYVCENYRTLGKMFWYVREKFFGDLPPTRQQFWGEILISDGRAN